MKKLTLYAVIAVIILGIIAAVIISLLRPDSGREPAETQPVASDVSGRELTEYAENILKHISAGDYASLGAVVHPEYGVVFSPYSTVDLSADRRFTAAQVADFEKDSQTYI